MNRRSFFQAAAATGLVATLPTLEGCGLSEVENAINVVLREAAAVLAVAEPNASWLAPLQQAIASLMTAEQQWQNGGPVQVVDDALNTIVAITAVIPLTAVYSPLIDVLVAAIETVLALLPAPATGVAKATRTGNPRVGRYTLKSYWDHPTPAGRFKKNWNDVATANKLDYAVLK
jgi:hypothetical protein